MKKKKVLILAYDFPPYISVGGMRPYGWFKYLPKDLFEVTIVTRQWSSKVNSAIDCILPTSSKLLELEHTTDGRIFRAPFQPNLRDKILIKYGFDKFGLIRKGMSFFIDLFKHTFSFCDSSRTIYNAANSLCENEPFDVIIATGEPFILFKHAHQLSKKHHIKWVGDYRDGWTTNQRKDRLGFAESIINNNYKRKEKKYIKTASLITTAADEYRSELSSIINADKIHVVLNGFISRFSDLKIDDDKKDIFEISYLGTLYAHQNIEMFMEGVEKFISNTGLSINKFRIKFIGLNFYPDQKERVLKCSEAIHPYLIFTDKVPYEQLVKEVKESSLLLLMSKKKMNWLNAKVFDYLMFNKPVLFMGNDDGVLDNILIEVNNSTMRVNTTDEVFNTLSESYGEFLKDGYLKNSNIQDKVFNYSRENQTLKLSNLLMDEVFHSH